ncbi:MAG: serine hydrolase [Vicinamibacterales bacterium]
MKRIGLVAVFSLSLLPPPINAQPPLQAGGAGLQPPLLATAAALKAQFAERLEAIARQVDGVVGYTIVDLTSGDRFARFENSVFPTASTIKLAILYELYVQAQEGRVRLDAVKTLDRAAAVGGSGVLFELGTPSLALRDYAVLMIVLSDNTATNVLIDTLGMSSITSRMRALGLGETRLRRKMIDLAAARRGDENVSTPAEIARLLEIYYKGEGLQPASRDDALAILKKDKDTPLVRGLPAGTVVASKPGELEGVRVDAGIVFARNRPYILSIMTSWLADDEAGAKAIEALSRAAYGYFSRLGAGSDYGRRIGR